MNINPGMDIERKRPQNGNQDVVCKAHCTRHDISSCNSYYVIPAVATVAAGNFMPQGRDG